LSKYPPNTRLILKGKTHKAKSHLVNFGDHWTVKHATGSKHEGTFLVGDGPMFEAFWLGPDYEVVEVKRREF